MMRTPTPMNARHDSNAKEPAMNLSLKTMLTLVLAVALPALSGAALAHAQDEVRTEAPAAHIALLELPGRPQGGDYGV